MPDLAVTTASSPETQPLKATAFFDDSEVQGALHRLLQCLERHQQDIAAPRPPSPERTTTYEEKIAKFSQMRGGNLYYPYLGSGIGRGPLVELEDGSIKYDFISGIGVHHFGHSHLRLTEAALKAALADTIMQGNLQQNSISVEFTELLLDAANTKGAGFDHCFLSSTGVMAGENSLKIAMQKKYPADRVLAFERCFAGRTMTFSQITDKAAFRVGLPTTLNVDYIPFYDESDPEGSTRRAHQVLESHLKRYPGKYAAMSFELIQGEGGFYSATPEFHRGLMQTVRAAGIAVLVDEVQTFARTSQMFAYQYFGLDDLVDLVWIGKSSQVCATLFRKDFAPKPGLLSQTFTASSTALAGGKTILQELIHGGYFGANGKIERIHNQFRQRLEALSDQLPDIISGPYGVGAMVACTLFGGDPGKSGAFMKKLYHNGVMGFVAGGNPTRVRFLVPIGAVQEADIEAVADIFEKTLVDFSRNDT